MLRKSSRHPVVRAPTICIASRDGYSFYFGSLCHFISSPCSSRHYALEESHPHTFLFFALVHYSFTAYRPACRKMVDTQRHSFEEASPTGNHTHRLTSHSRSESTGDSCSIQLTEFATINLPFFETPTASQSSPSRKPRAPPVLTPAPRFKENRVKSPQRGRSIVRSSIDTTVPRNYFRSPISPDRFIPKRDLVEPTSTTFRVTKHPQRLLPQEKLLRRLPPGDDPFMPPAPRRTPVASGSQPPTRLQRIPHHRPRLVTELTIASNNFAHRSLRHVSSGAVWNVGGVSAVLGGSLIATPDDTPVTSSNSNRSTAPIFVARFLPKKPKFSEDEIHESRLALALGVDPTIRQLTTCLRCLDAPLSPTSPDYERLAPFVWKDSDWKKSKKEHCKRNSHSLVVHFGTYLPHTDAIYITFKLYFWKL